jgi:hypothetical protein
MSGLAVRSVFLLVMLSSLTFSVHAQTTNDNAAIHTA